MSSQKKITDILGICRKAGMLLLGFDSAKEALISGKAKIILLTEDASPKTLKESEFYAKKTGKEVLTINCTMDDTQMLFHKKTAVMAVLDEGFAESIKKHTEV